MAQTPDEEVADRILGEAGKEKLLDAVGLQKAKTLLLSGKSRPEDWRFLLETPSAKGAPNGKSSR